jgi:hypothetical protein
MPMPATKKRVWVTPRLYQTTFGELFRRQTHDGDEPPLGVVPQAAAGNDGSPAVLPPSPGGAPLETTEDVR